MYGCVCPCKHKHRYMHACMHTYMHACIHTCIHTHTCMHACIHTYMHACMHAYIHTYTHTYTHTHIHTYMNERFLIPVVFVKGKLILGFCTLAAIWLETQAAQERARASARILYIHVNFVHFRSCFPTYYTLKYIACMFM